MVFEQVIRDLDRFGVADVLLPFFLVFTLCYAILTNIELFKDDASKKAINIVISVVIASAVVFMHVLYPGSPFNVVPMINMALPWIAGLLVIVLAAHLIIGLAAGEAYSPGARAKTAWIPLAVVIVVLYIFFSASGLAHTPYWLRSLFDRSFIYIVLAIAVFGGLIYYITKN